jgi:hypothetical protein
MLELAHNYAGDPETTLLFVLLILNDKPYHVFVRFIVFTWARYFQQDTVWLIVHNLNFNLPCHATDTSQPKSIPINRFGLQKAQHTRIPLVPWKYWQDFKVISYCVMYCGCHKWTDMSTCNAHTLTHTHLLSLPIFMGHWTKTTAFGLNYHRVLYFSVSSPAS